MELLEDAGPLLLRDAWSGIGHSYAEVTIDRSCLDTDLADVGELDRVSHVVE